MGGCGANGVDMSLRKLDNDRLAASRALSGSTLSMMHVCNAPTQEAAEALFQHLCHLVDSAKSGAVDNKDGPPDAQLVAAAKQAIIDGAAVFFPDKNARRKQLFNMIASGNVSAHSVTALKLAFLSPLPMTI